MIVTETHQISIKILLCVNVWTRLTCDLFRRRRHQRKVFVLLTSGEGSFRTAVRHEKFGHNGRANGSSREFWPAICFEPETTPEESVRASNLWWKIKCPRCSCSPLSVKGQMFETFREAVLNPVVSGGRRCSGPLKDISSLVHEACMKRYLCCEPEGKSSVQRSALSGMSSLTFWQDECSRFPIDVVSTNRIILLDYQQTKTYRSQKKSHAPGSIFTATECPIRSQTKLDEARPSWYRPRDEETTDARPNRRSWSQVIPTRSRCRRRPHCFLLLAETFFLSFCFVERTLFAAWYPICSPNSKM